ncbi:MAG TPA: HRDC domain-containing protein [Anaerolineales bacterium]
MSTESLPPPLWVNTGPFLARMIADLSSQPRLAVDTESNSLHAYRERVCLIQFSTPQTDYILDPLEFADLSSLAPIFQDPAIEKIFHAVEYDLICLRRDYGFGLANLFDTMQAARILGYPAVGLDRLLNDKFGILVDKRYQKADWAARPLTAEQIHYARLDTHHLFQLRDVFEAELREKGRWLLAQEDFRRSCDPEQPKTRAAGEVRERFSGRRDLSPRELTVVNELVLFRELIAEQMDRPPFKVMDDETLIAVARAAPQTQADLAAAGVSGKQIRLWGQAILAAVQRGAEAPLAKRKQVSRPTDATLARAEKLKDWRKKVAKEMGVESDIVLPKPYIQLLAENSPRTQRDLENLMVQSPWRFEAFGAQILELLGG